MTATVTVTVIGEENADVIEEDANVIGEDMTEAGLDVVMTTLSS
ncbi:hypothetical protein OPLHCY645_07410 [Clostridium tetani]|nr:hypothetical protein [Clostridium tetani]